MKNNLISICIPYKNSPDFLDELFVSIKEQTYKNYEIIICDDRSTKENRDILEKKISEYFSDYKIVTGKGKGTFLARQVAMKSARGEIILNADADDKYLGNGFFEYINTVFNCTACDTLMFSHLNIDINIICHEILNDNSVCPISKNDVSKYLYQINKCSASLSHDKSNKKIDMFLSLLDCKSVNNNVLINEAINDLVAHYVWNKAISSSLVKNFIIDDVENIIMGDDRLYSLLILLFSKKIVRTNHIAYYYRQNPLSITHSKSPFDVCLLCIRTEQRINTLFTDYPQYHYDYTWSFLWHIYYFISKIGLDSRDSFYKEVKKIKTIKEYKYIMNEYSKAYKKFHNSIKLNCFNYLFSEQFSKLYFFAKHKRLYWWHRAIIKSKIMPNILKETRKVYIPELGKYKFIRIRDN